MAPSLLNRRRNKEPRRGVCQDRRRLNAAPDISPSLDAPTHNWPDVPTIQNVEAIRQSVIKAVDDFDEWLQIFKQIDARTAPHALVYVMVLNGEVLDLFSTVIGAVATARAFMDKTPAHWHVSRPGRWWSMQGTLEISVWSPK